MTKSFQIISGSELTDELVDQIRSLDSRVDWGQPAEVASLVWAGSPSERVAVAVVLLDGNLASHVAVVEREIAIGGRSVRVAGISSVMTEPGLEGQGFATAALLAATELIRKTLDVPLAVLTCLDHRCSFYARFGWIETDAAVYCDQPTGQALLNGPGRHVMVLPVGSAPLPTEPIDLRGLPW